MSVRDGILVCEDQQQLHNQAQMAHTLHLQNMNHMVAGEGFEPSKAEPGDLQSPPIGRSGNPPRSNVLRRVKITSN